MTLAPFDLNLRHLRALPVIIARGSMSAAAAEVALSQPALTQGLARIEDQLGVALLERRPDGVRPTHEGTLLAGRVTEALRLLEADSRGTGLARQAMTATQLRAFRALADAGSFVGAAAATGLSQPALHRAVRDLERLCSVPLVERRGRGVATTAPGRRLARGVRLAERELEMALAEIAVHADRVVVGAMPLSRAELIPRGVARLVRAAPEASVDIVDGSWSELVELLRDGVIDLMTGALRPEPPADLHQEVLFRARLVVVGSARHPLAQEPRPTLRQLASYPWIVGRTGTPLRARWERLFTGMERPAAPIECGSVTTIRGILRQSECLTLLSPDQFAFEAEAGMLRAIGGSWPDLDRVIGVTTRHGWRPGPLGERFRAILREAAVELG